MGLVKAAPHEGVTYKIIGECIKVHNDLGPGHREAAYQSALVAGFQRVGLSFEDELNIEVFDEEGVRVQLYQPDFRVESCVLVEIKAHTHNLTNDEIAQVIDYFAGSNCDIGLLINFGRPRLEWKRLFPPRQISIHRRRKWGKQAD